MAEIEKDRNLGRVPIAFESYIPEKFSWKQIAFRWESSKNTSFKRRTRTVEISRLHKNAIVA